MITMTSGLHAAPVSATEHRSSTDQSTRDTQTISLAANLQVTALLRVRRQGLEPRTRGLRGQSSPIRRTTTCDHGSPRRRRTGTAGRSRRQLLDSRMDSKSTVDIEKRAVLLASLASAKRPTTLRSEGRFPTRDLVSGVASLPRQQTRLGLLR